MAGLNFFDLWRHRAVGRHRRRATGPPTDDEIIYTDPNSGRQWSYGEVRKMSEEERRRLETGSFSDVFRMYRARLFWNFLPPEVRQRRAKYRRRGSTR